MGGIVNVMGLNVNTVNERELKGLLQSYINSDAINVVYMVSLGTLKSVVQDPDYRENVPKDADLVLPAEEVVLSRVHRRKIRGAVDNYRIFMKTLESMCNGRKVYVIGEDQKSAELMVQILLGYRPDILLCGMYSMDMEYNDESVINDINGKVPDVLLLGFKSPAVEIWISEHRPMLNAKLIVGLGDISEDMIRENTRPAGWITKLGLENIYSNIINRKHGDNKRKERILDSLLAEYNSRDNQNL